MTLRMLVLACGLIACTPASGQDIYGVLNTLRLRLCPGGAALAPLKHDPRLDGAAAEVARGADLTRALKTAGYRHTRSLFISVTGTTSDAELMAAMNRNYCAQLTDAELAEAGVHRAGPRTVIVLAAPFAPRVAQTPAEAGRTILALVNEARRKPRSCGDKTFKAAEPLKWNETLYRASLSHAGDMGHHGYFSHEGRDGSTPAQRVTRAGYRYRATGENIAAGMTRAEDAVQGWIKSPGHCANLMNPVFTEMGAAYATNAQSPQGVYWVQSFGTPR